MDRSNKLMRDMIAGSGLCGIGRGAIGVNPGVNSYAVFASDPDKIVERIVTGVAPCMPVK